MPRLGLTMVEGTVVEWRAKPGRGGQGRAGGPRAREEARRRPRVGGWNRTGRANFRRGRRARGFERARVGDRRRGERPGSASRLGLRRGQDELAKTDRRASTLLCDRRL